MGPFKKKLGNFYGHRKNPKRIEDAVPNNVRSLDGRLAWIEARGFVGISHINRAFLIFPTMPQDFRDVP
jgi:hypothetical protein